MSSAVTLSHVTVSTTDVAATAAIFDAALGALGLTRVVELRDEEEDEGPIEAIGYGGPGSSTDDAQVWLVASDEATRLSHIALRAPGAAQVTDFFNAAIAAGGLPRQRPRRWEIFRPGYFGASVADLNGNVIEVFAFEGTSTI